VHYKLTIAYDGTAFRGWARQPGQRTIEGVFRDALTSIYGTFGGPAVAGRTDTGVHAYANVLSFVAEGGPAVERAARALNAVLPNDLAVVHADEAPDNFNARFSARSRTYRYRIWRRRERSPFEVNRSLWHPGRIELQKLTACAAMVIGEHDFRAFTPTDTQHGSFVRTVEDARWFERGDAIELEITADAFLRHMVRTLVGTMLECDPDDFVALLAGAPRENAGSTAPAHGLYLTAVGY
jgi:tRNA pseudouridine38-40 synthase